MSGEYRGSWRCIFKGSGEQRSSLQESGWVHQDEDTELINFARIRLKNMQHNRNHNRDARKTYNSNNSSKNSNKLTLG